VKVHYRIYGGRPKILAYGCGWAGAPGAKITADARKVTCAKCKTTKEWRDVMKAISMNPRPA